MSGEVTSATASPGSTTSDGPIRSATREATITVRP